MMRRLVVGALSLGFAVLVGCTAKNPDFCQADGECDDPTKPFCDVNGEFAESGHTPNICTARPAGCSIERCGCDAGTGLSCDLDQLTVCNPDGHSSSVETCALGCSTEPRCLTFEPSNGLGPALAMAASEPDVVLPPGTRIDTDLGTVTSASGPVMVKSAVVAQQNGRSIRVFLGGSFLADDVQVMGGSAVALVATGSITIRGPFKARASGAQAGPGGQDLPAVCAGADQTQIVQSGTVGFNTIAGPGGGGNATAGGAGGARTPSTSPVGALIPDFEPLVGGCRGGSQIDSNGVVMARGGGGGGAVQLVSLTEISFTTAGMLDVGGGGGASLGTGTSKFSGAGGSGGTVVLEAPRVRFEGATTGLAANGGAGGSCQMQGADGSASAAVAHADASCTDASAGDGGTGAVLPTGKLIPCPQGNFCAVNFDHWDGGGGAAGRVRVVTKDSMLTRNGSPVISAMISLGQIVPQ